MSEPNPYRAPSSAPPPEGETATGRPVPVRSIVGAVILSLLMGGFTLFTTCLASVGFLGALPGPSEDYLPWVVFTPVVLSIVVGLLSLRSMLRGILNARKNAAHQPPVSGTDN